MKGYHSAATKEKMSLEDCLELGRRCAEGDLNARETLIVSHMYLIESVLFSFRNKGVDTEDLFQEGCYGLMKAVDLYDYKRGYRFSTYAVHWIRKQMRLALRKQGSYRPVTLKDDEFWLLVKICTVANRLHQEFGYEPSCEEIAENLNVSVEQTARLLSFKESFVNIDDVMFMDNVSIHGRSAEEEFLDKLLNLDDMPLSSREKEILSRHFGSTGSGEEESLKEIAAALRLSYETVRLDYRSALQKIKMMLVNEYEGRQGL